MPVSRAAKKEAARQKKKTVAEREETLDALRFREGKQDRQKAFEEKQMCEHEAAVRRKAEAAEKKEAERRMRKALPALEEEFAPPVHDEIKLWTGHVRSLGTLPGELLLTSEEQEGDGFTSVCAKSELCSVFEETLHFKERVDERGVDAEAALEGEAKRLPSGAVIHQSPQGDSVVRVGKALVTAYKRE